MLQIWSNIEPRILPLYRRRKIRVLTTYLYINNLF